MATNISNSKSPLYEQVANDLRMKLLAGEWQVGDRIPPEVELCKVYHVSRITIRRAIESLASEGLLYRQRAKGTFVKDFNEAAVEHFTMVKSFTREMAELGKVAKTMFAEISVKPASADIAPFLNLETGDSMIELRRIRGTRGQQFAYFKTFIPYDARLSMNSADYYGSFYDYLAKFGIIVTHQKEYIESVLPNPEVQTSLSIDRSLPVLKRVRFISNNDASYMEFSECYYIGSQYRYYVDFD